MGRVVGARTLNRLRDRVQILIRDVRTSLRQHDVLLAAAGLTFYAVIAVVPLLLLAFWLSGLVLGAGELTSLASNASQLLGNRHGVADAVDTVARAGVRPRLTTVLTSALVAAWYGEGLSRALGRFSERTIKQPGARGRLGVPLLVVSTAVLLTVGLLIGRGLTLALGESAHPTVPRVYLAFVVVWAGLSVNVGLCYLVFGRLRLTAGTWWMAILGASWIAGSALGFLLVASWPINLRAPFAGSQTLGTAALVAVWLYFSHVALLTGYAAAVRFAEKGDGHRARDWESSPHAGGMPAAPGAEHPAGHADERSARVSETDYAK